MPESWPHALPQRMSSEDYSEGVGDGLIETQPDIGPPISRRRSTAVSRPLSGSMRVTAAQLAVFRTFYEVTVLGGSLPFEFPGQCDETVLLVKFQKSNPPTWTNLGADNWNLSLQLTVLP